MTTANISGDNDYILGDNDYILGDNDYILGDTDYILGDNHNNFYDTENILVIQMGDKLVTKWVTFFFFE